jgi:hypothetical protein
MGTIGLIGSSQPMIHNESIVQLINHFHVSGYFSPTIHADSAPFGASFCGDVSCALEEATSGYVTVLYRWGETALRACIFGALEVIVACGGDRVDYSGSYPTGDQSTCQNDSARGERCCVFARCFPEYASRGSFAEPTAVG